MSVADAPQPPTVERAAPQPAPMPAPLPPAYATPWAAPVQRPAPRRDGLGRDTGRLLVCPLAGHTPVGWWTWVQTRLSLAVMATGAVLHRYRIA